MFCLGSCRDTQFEITNEGSSSSGSTQFADVVGTVTDSQGNPIAGVAVVTIPFNREVTLDSNGRKVIQQAVTDANGRYQIDELPQGTYKLLFLASGFIKVSVPVGPVDFVPDNLVNGQINKGTVLQVFPAQNDGDSPAVALFDPEDKQRMTELLTAHGIRYQSMIGQMNQLDANNFNVLVIGLDATVFSPFSELVTNQAVIDNFLANGGSIYIGQINDFTVEATPIPFLIGDQQFALHTEDAPFNDFVSGNIVDPNHPLVAGVSFTDWSYIEAGQQTVKQNVVFDAALKSSIENSPNWNIVVTTPAEDFTSGSGTVLAESDVIIAEYTDPRSSSKIVLNQAAYYQSTFGDVTDANGIRLTNNVIAYIKSLNQ
nr:carboxypeptidase-like regulatory domain-containing protein [Pleionea sp. CnH1-48]